MSHLHSLAQSMYIATFLPEHVLTTCCADYVTSTSGAIRLAFDLLPLASSVLHGFTLKSSCLACSAQAFVQLGNAPFGFFGSLIST